MIDFSKIQSKVTDEFVNEMSIKCDYYSQFIDSITKSLDESKKNLQQRYDQAMEEIHPDDSESKWDVESDFIEEWKYTGIFSPSVFYNSIFVNINSFFENSLKQLCIEMYRMFETKPFDFANKKGIISYKGCLKNYINFSVSDTVYKDLENFNQMRNIIAHRNGDMVNNKEYNIVKGYKQYVTFSRDKRTFAINSIDLLKLFLKHIEYFYDNIQMTPQYK